MREVRTGRERGEVRTGWGEMREVRTGRERGEVRTGRGGGRLELGGER